MKWQYAVVLVVAVTGCADSTDKGNNPDDQDQSGGCGGGGSDVTSTGQLASFSSGEMGSGEWNSYSATVSTIDNSVVLTSQTQGTRAAGVLTTLGQAELADLVDTLPIETPSAQSTCGDGVGMTVDISYAIGGLHHYAFPLGDSCGQPAELDELSAFLVGVATAIQTGSATTYVTVN